MQDRVPLPEKLLEAVEARREEVTALTRELIRFPTVNPPGEAYTPCAEFIGDYLKRHGFGSSISVAKAHPATPIAIRAPM